MSARASRHPAGARVFGFAGWSGSGKTTVIEQLIPRLVARGFAVSLVKHAHHAFDIDMPGKDSFRHRAAGCTEVLVSSATRYALMHELRGAAELTLAQALARLGPCDLVLVEGYKRATIPKLEVWRAEVGKPQLHPGDPNIVAIATDTPHAVTASLPVLDLADYAAMADLVLAQAIAPTGVD
jgi:molybdopterin-guanine dinucleotide biosynthesis adapter protein